MQSGFTNYFKSIWKMPHYLFVSTKTQFHLVLLTFAVKIVSLNRFLSSSLFPSLALYFSPFVQFSAHQRQYRMNDIALCARRFDIIFQMILAYQFIPFASTSRQIFTHIFFSSLIDSVTICVASVVYRSLTILAVSISSWRRISFRILWTVFSSFDLNFAYCALSSSRNDIF